MSQQNEQIQEQQVRQKINQLDIVVKQFMTKDALQRYTNVKLAHPEKALNLILLLSQGIEQGKITQVSDEELKNYLRMMEPEKRKIIINK